MFIIVFRLSGLGNFILSNFLSAAKHVSSVVLGVLCAALVLVGARASPSAPRQQLLKTL